MKDIEYFSESRLDAESLNRFWNNLPNRRLQNMIELYSRDTAFKLQGYRGPRRLCNGSSGDSGNIGPINEIETVKFRHNFSKWGLLVAPVFLGFRLYGNAKDMDGWQVLYFEENSGELLSNSWSRANDIIEERRKEKLAKQHQKELAEQRKREEIERQKREQAARIQKELAEQRKREEIERQKRKTR
jgi:hypothetical protein